MALTTIQETMVRNHADFKIEIGEMKGEIWKLDDKTIRSNCTIQQRVAKTEHKMKAVEAKVEQTDKNIESIEQKLMGENRKLEEAIAFLEMEKADFFLRFQNVTEERGEDLPKLMADLIAEALQNEDQGI
uniref:Uncharacterized protein n=1 Tax=Micrurus corallinus TaxID=54390 RepID=A0A2D4GKR2_MICCO